MSGIPVQSAIERALPQRLKGHFAFSCARCLEHAATALKAALDNPAGAATPASLYIFEEFALDANRMYGLARGEIVEVFAQCQDFFGCAVTEDLIQAAKSAHPGMDLRAQIA